MHFKNGTFGVLTMGSTLILFTEYFSKLMAKAGLHGLNKQPDHLVNAVFDH